MNERIKELAAQANIEEAYYPAGCNGYPAYRYYFDKEKFADLIVRECIATMKNTMETQCDSVDEKYGCTYAIMDVSDHFGIVNEGDRTFRI